MNLKEFAGKYIKKTNGVFSVIYNEKGNIVIKHKAPSVFVNYIGSIKGFRADPNLISFNVGKEDGNNLWISTKKDCGNIAIISAQEHLELTEKFNSFKLEESDLIGHYRSEDGVPKIAWKSRSDAQICWWRMLEKYPDKKFVAYRCNECGLYHVGKDKTFLI